MARLLSKDGSAHVTDEIFSAVIAGLGALLAVIGVVFLVLKGLREGEAVSVLGFSVYGAGLIAMFLSSALHHGINGSPMTNHLLRQFDYYAIFVMIAGSFTPFCLILFRNTLGWTVLGLVWGLAIGGIALKSFWPHVPRWFLTSIFLGMGWLGLMIARPMYLAIHWEGLGFMILGGIFYTIGAVIYGLEKPNPFPGRFGFHEIWHCFVLAGAASHFLLIYHWL